MLCFENWNGIALWLSTDLFIAAITFYLLGKTKKQKAMDYNHVEYPEE